MINAFDTFIAKQYIAHRGYHDDKNPENSMGAFLRAVKNGYAIELDIHLLSDGTLAVMHDSSLKRMTGQSGYLERLKKEDLKNYKLSGTKWTIPALDEVLTAVNGKVPLLFEIKNNERPGNLEKTLLKTLRAYKGEYAVVCFNPRILLWFKENAPDILRGQDSCFFKKGTPEAEGLSPLLKWSLKRMLFNKRTQPHFIAYKDDELPNRFVKRCKDIPVLAWPVPSQERYYKVAPHCDNMIFENFDIKKLS